MIFFTLQSNNQNADQAAFAQTAKSLGFEKVDKLSPKDTAGLAISYAHMHFKDDPSWDKTFDDAENGDLHIKALPEYEFGDIVLKPLEMEWYMFLILILVMLFLMFIMFQIQKLHIF